MTLRPKAKTKLGRTSKNAKGTKGDVLRMILRHGDLIVMHGPEIQKLYEVSFIAMLIFVSMLILPNSIR